MSLVNDMLRDLDTRRRDAPTQGLGAEKLVPATERVKRRNKVRSGVVALVLATIFACLIVVYLVMVSAGNRGALSPDQRVPIVQLPATESPVLTDSAIIAPPATQGESAMSSAMLSQLEQRLAHLEAQNLALLASQERENLNSPSFSEPAVPTPVAQENLLSEPLQNRADSPVYSQEWADAPALSATDPSPPDAALTDNAPARESTSSRSPRALSFQDTERQQVHLALQQWSSGQQLAALQTLDSFAHEYPDAHTARETLAKLLIQQGETERAMQAAELGLALSPNNNGYRKVKARLLVADSRAEEAVALLTSFAPAVAADTEYHDLLASSYLANQQYQFAEQTYSMLLQQNSTEGRWWYGLAAAYDTQGLTQDAASAYERALQQANLPAGLRQTSQQRLQLIRQSSAAR